MPSAFTYTLRNILYISVLPKFEVEINMDKCKSRFSEKRFSGSVIAR